MSNVSPCDISADAKDRLKTLKKRQRDDIAAIVLKVDSNKQIVVDEEYEGTSIDEVAGELPESQPRYVVFSYVHKHDDGRASYPYFLVFCSPQGRKCILVPQGRLIFNRFETSTGCQTTQQMMYAGSLSDVVDEAKATKVFHVRSTEELTEDFIKDELKKLFT